MSMTVSAVKADLYGRDRYDMAAFVFGPEVTMAGVFTQNAFAQRRFMWRALIWRASPGLG